MASPAASPAAVLEPWSQLATKAQTGDVILMHGDFPGSVLIELFEGSTWSHSGMIVRAADIGKAGVYPDLLFWESNTLTNLPDLIDGKGKTGPMLVDLEQRLITNARDFKEAEMTYVPVSINRQPADWTALWKFMNSPVHQATFPSELEMAWEEIEGRVFRKQSRLDKVFCSELVAGSMQSMGWMGTDWPWNAYEPGDFVKPGAVKLLRGGTLGKNIRFDPTK